MMSVLVGLAIIGYAACGPIWIPPVNYPIPALATLLEEVCKLTVRAALFGGGLKIIFESLRPDDRHRTS